jgi:hypothetical protein
MWSTPAPGTVEHIENIPYFAAGLTAISNRRHSNIAGPPAPVRGGGRQSDQLVE